MNDRLKILLLPNWYPSRERPLEGIFIRELAKASATFADVAVLFPQGCGQTNGKMWCLKQEQDAELSQGIPTYRFHYRRTWPVTFLTSSWSLVRACRHFARTVFRPDIIHAHVYSAGLPAVPAGWAMKIPVVVTEHSTVFARQALGRRERWKARFVFKHAQLVMPVSVSLQQAIEQLCPKARCKVVPNTVDTELFHPPPPGRTPRTTKQIITICMLDRTDKKGLGQIFAALAQLGKIRQDWHLNLVGDGPSRGRHQSTVEQLGLAENVTFHGSKTKPQVAEMLRDADLFVLPSLFETFSLTTAEALATGVPVVVTRCGGPEHFVTPDDGLVVPPAQPQALAEAIGRMLDEYPRYQAGAMSARIARQFGFAAVARQLEQAYREVLENYRARR